MRDDFDVEWPELAEDVLTGMKEWRLQHPKARLSEFEQAVDERLGRVRARLLQDWALASAVADIKAAQEQERPVCPKCGRVLESRGQHERALTTHHNQTLKTDQLHHLKHDGPTSVLAEAHQLSVAHPDLSELPKHLAYLEKREAQMQYPAFQAAGWPIGDGAVEGGNKQITGELRRQAAQHHQVAAKAKNTLRGIARIEGNHDHRGENTHGAPRGGNSHHAHELVRAGHFVNASNQRAAPSRRQSSVATYAHRPGSLQLASKTRQRKTLNRTRGRTPGRSRLDIGCIIKMKLF